MKAVSNPREKKLLHDDGTPFAEDVHDMLAAKRRELIVRSLDHEGSVSVSQLSERFGVSEVTIRQDLKWLESRGVLTRIHGGAVPKYRSGAESSVTDRTHVASAEKRKIAMEAAKIVERGDVVLLTDGTSTLQLAYQIKQKDVTIVTNGWNIVAELGHDSSANLISLGGMLRHVTMSYVGPITLSALEQLRVDRLFLGIDGLSDTHGCTTPHMMECEVYRAMMGCAKQVVVLADYTKLGKEYMYRITSLDEVDAIVLDDRAPQDVIRSLRDRGIEVFVASDEHEPSPGNSR